MKKECFYDRTSYLFEVIDDIQSECLIHGTYKCEGCKDFVPEESGLLTFNLLSLKDMNNTRDRGVN